MAQMGRPRTFDRDAAITQAMHLFWEHGYDSTSLSQLKANMGSGISAPSFSRSSRPKPSTLRTRSPSFPIRAWRWCSTLCAGLTRNRSANWC